MNGVRLNKDYDLVSRIKEGLRLNDGYCPCMLQKSKDTKCMCKDFRDKIADPSFVGYCHCELYYKEKTNG